MADILPVSPLAPAGGFPDLPVIPGVRFAATAAGIKYKDRADVMLAELAPGTTIAGTFTRSKTRAAPVLDCQEKIGLPSEAGAAIVVNSGNANAFTGVAGVNAVKAVTKAAADATGIPEARVFTSSTGVIGEPLPHDRITATLAALVDGLDEHGISEAARAIMTTDTFPKGAGRTVEVDGNRIRVAGIAKGSGMIAPDMATMLAYIFTDARISQDKLQSLVAAACDETFNRITVDSDTSTSDTLLVAATGASGVGTEGSGAFAAALADVMDDLARQIVRDGEGASKFVTVGVTGAATESDARKVAFAIANSPLVKTAIAGEDPNWGRVVMAVGKSGAEADRDRLSIRFGDVLVAKDGSVAPGFLEAEAARHMSGGDVSVSVDLGLGVGTATVYTCDLTSRYIAINADYRFVNVVLVSAVALVDTDGRVLLAQRPDGKSMAGLWEFPGGKIEEGEAPEAALIRELREELGIETWESCLAPLTFASHAYDDFHLLMPLFACRKWQGTPVSREGQTLKWVRPAVLRDYPMPPADIPLIPVLRDWL